MSSYAEEDQAPALESPAQTLRGAKHWASHLGLARVPAWVRYPAFLLLAIVLAKVDWDKAAYILRIQPFAIDYLPDTLSGADFPMHLAHHERAIASGLASGAAEIQLNLIAIEHLQLPREPRA